MHNANTVLACDKFRLSSILALYFLRYLDFARLLLGLFGLFLSIIFLYFFYRMIRPPNGKQYSKNNFRTIRDVFVSGRDPQEIKEESVKIKIVRVLNGIVWGTTATYARKSYPIMFMSIQ